MVWKLIAYPHKNILVWLLITKIFNENISEKLSKASKGVGILRKLFYLIPRTALVPIYKAFVRPHLDYTDFIYDKPKNSAFIHNIEAIQYNAALAITGAIKEKSRQKLLMNLVLNHWALEDGLDDY